jgi:serine/threonine-protein kinase
MIGTAVAGKYRITQMIGVGGAGQVFEAKNLAVGRLVAIKIVRSTIGDSPERLLREAQLAAAIRHPNICGVYDLGYLPNGDPFLVMERLFGETLHDRLRRRRNNRPLRLPLTLDVFVQLLSALHAAHSVGVLHRDLKPANVFLVERDGCPPLAKLLDFGFAKDMTGLRARAITQPHQACGTPQYMSPEQLRAQALDARSDLFAVGVMLYEALAGRHPFMAPTVPEISFRILEAEAPRLRAMRPRLTPELEALVARALAKTRADRFQSARAMLEAIDDARSAQAESSVESAPSSTTDTWILRCASSSSSGAVPGG